MISECGLRIADFECEICLIFQSAIRNLKSAIDFNPEPFLTPGQKSDIILGGNSFDFKR